MRIVGECSMNLDEQRKVWVSVSGDIDMNDPNAGEATKLLAEAAAKAATNAYDHALARLHGQPTQEEIEDRPPAQGTPGWTPPPGVELEQVDG